MRKIIWVLLPLLCISLIAQAQTKADALKKIMNDPLLKTTQVGIAVFDLTAGESLFNYNDQQLFRPASVQKVTTAITSLARLGEDFTFNTELGYTGRIQNDTLYGSLYVIGGGNPLLSETDIQEFIHTLSTYSIHHITDSIVADISLTDSLYWGPGWSWDDAPYAFQPTISSLVLNKGCVELEIYPTKIGESPGVVYTPAAAPITIRNEAVSHLSTQGKLKVERNWSVGGNEISISGSVNQTVKRTIAVANSHQLFLSVFLERLRSAGISGGTPVTSRVPISRNGFSTLLTHTCPLKDVLEPTLKESDNLCAEALFFQLGTQYTDSCTTLWEDGAEAMNKFLKDELGFTPDNYRIVDGSGLSLYNYLSPALIIAYLKYAYYNPKVFHPFYTSLPIAGVDGTLHYRMKEGKAFRNVRAKTGSVTGVSTLAGYVKASNGHQLAFVIMNQGVLKLRTARLFQDRICTILAQ